MPTRSKIEWTDYTWNPVTGCTNISPGCGNCYAETITNRFQWHPWGEIQLRHDRLQQPPKWDTGTKIFMASMGDIFHSGVPFDFIAKIFDVIEDHPENIFQVLTKRPGRMAYFANVELPRLGRRWPQNAWAGTSVELQKYAPRMDFLMEIETPVRFVSYEPALGPIDWGPYLRWEDLDLIPTELRHRMRPRALSNGINWTIAGGESGPAARPSNPAWYRELRDYSNMAQIAFFFKQWGRYGSPIGVPLEEARNWESKWVLVDRLGEILPTSTSIDTPGAEIMVALGKAKTGAELDGREHKAFPELVPA